MRERIAPGPGQESVWDYPRPPAVQPSTEHVVVRLGTSVVVDTRRALRVLETSHPPTYYLPLDDFADGALVASDAPTTAIRSPMRGAASLGSRSARVRATRRLPAAMTTAVTAPQVSDRRRPGWLRRRARRRARETLAPLNIRVERLVPGHRRARPGHSPARPAGLGRTPA